MSKYYYSKADIKAMSNERLLAAYLQLGAKAYKLQMRKAEKPEAVEREILTFLEELNKRFGVCHKKIMRCMKR